MTFYNFIAEFLAWLPAVFILLLTIIYPLRLYCKRKKLSQISVIAKVNKVLRKAHKALGLITIFLTFVHCRTSSQKLGLNIGTACLILLILLWLTYVFRKQLNKHWIVLHRILTVILVGVLIAHILVLRLTTLNI